MDQSYSLSYVAAYGQHLPVRTVRLPLKYPSAEPMVAPNDLFHKQLLSTGSIANLADAGSSLVENVAYGLQSDLRTLRLVPLLLQTNSLDLHFQAVHIELPHPVSQGTRVNVGLLRPGSGSHEDPALVVDLVDENFLFITLRVELTDFLVHETSHRFALDDFLRWGHISVPYSFELRSLPFFVRSLDLLNVVVGLKDGGLLHFKRLALLAPFDVYNFTESVGTLPLNFISGIFSRSLQKEIVLEGISSNAVVDVVTLDDSSFATLSVSKVLKVWNLRSHLQVSYPIDLNEKDDEFNAWLPSVPSKYLQIVADSRSGKHFLALHVPSSAKNNNRSAVVFKVWELKSSSAGVELVSVDRVNFYPDLPSFFINSTSDDATESEKPFNSIWLVQDFQAQFIDDLLKVHILWKSNTSSFVVTYSIDFDSGAVSSIKWSINGETKTLREFAPYHDADYYSAKILNSGSYSELAVVTALNIFREHTNLDLIKNFNDISIRQVIHNTISASELDPRSSWYKLDLLCEEFNKISKESLAILVAKDSTIIALQADGLLIFRDSHYCEKFSQLNVLSSEGKLATILNNLSHRISNKSFTKLHRRVIESPKISTEEATQLYESTLMNKITNDDANRLMQELGNIPDVIPVIEKLIDSAVGASEGASSKLAKSASLGLLTKLSTIATFKSIKLQHETLLLNLLVAFLACEVSDQILVLINKITERISTYAISELVFNTAFGSGKPTSKVEHVKLNNLAFSVFWSGVADKNPYLVTLIKDGKIHQAYDYFFGAIASHNYSAFLTDIVLELLNHGEGELIRSKFLNSLNTSKAVNKFLIGLVYLINDEPGEYFSVYENYDVFKSVNTSEIKDMLLDSLTLNTNIKKFLESIFIEESNDLLLKANYYHALSELSISQGNYFRKHHSHHQKFITADLTTTTKTVNSTVEVEFLRNSLNFEKIAIDTLKELPNHEQGFEVSNLVEKFYLNVFDLSLNLSDNERTHEALLNLKGTLPSGDFRILFSKFIKGLVANHTISIIFPPNNKALYRDSYLLIDSILFELANEELELSNSLKSYEYLYSWRLFGPSRELESTQLADKRGAIESLYAFITRFKLEKSNLLLLGNNDDVKQYKLKILELFMIILNALKSFDSADDKWLTKVDKAGYQTIIRLDEINLEYLEWIKELENDFLE